MRTLYHFSVSPFSRRTRLALAHKGLEVDLRDARSRPEWLDEARRLVAVKTVPVLADGPHTLADSTANTRWLDVAYPTGPRIWPDGDDAFVALEVTTLVDTALDAIIDVGTRYYPLREHVAWGDVTREVLGRAQQALDAVGARARGLDRTTFAKSGWSAADMWVYTATEWLMGLPARVTTSPNAAQIMAVGGWTVPDALVRWAEDSAGRVDVKALADS